MSDHCEIKCPKVFVFIGPEKTGTTTVFDLLPFNRISSQKEMFNLSRKRDFPAEQLRIADQLSTQNAAYIVEPTYFVSEFAREKLAELSDRYDLHIIHTRRDPIDRMISHYLHHKSKGRITNPQLARKSFPEIIDASRYDFHAGLWADSFAQFHIIDIDGETDLRTSLTALGITPIANAAMKSNPRLAPRSPMLAKIASKLWEIMISVQLNRLIPQRFKGLAKKKIYYGGTRVEVSNEERECLIRMLSNTV